jgi:rubrerythrin
LEETNVKKLIDIYANAYLDETFSSNLYIRLSEIAEGSFSERLRELADMEAVHAEFWKEVLEELDFRTDNLKISKTKLAFFSLAERVLGLLLLIKLLEAEEEIAISLYTRILKEKWLPEERNIVLREILEDELLHESFFSKRRGKT